MVSARRPVLALLCAASFLAVVDTTIVTVALPSIQAALDLSASGASWVLSGYAVVFGGLLLLLGRLGDHVGRRRVFAAGLVVFLVGTAAAATASQPWPLLVGRCVQGAGAAAFVPASLSMLSTAYPEDPGRSHALSVYGSMAGLGFVSGMVGGGLLTEAWGWQWVFWVNVPVALILLAGTRLLPERRARERGPLDVGGAALLTSGLGLVLLALTSAPRHGGTSPAVTLTGAGGLALLVAFGNAERRHADPLVPPRVVARRKVLVPNTALALESMVGMGWLYLLSLYFQQSRHLGALETGLLFAPMTIASVVGAAGAGASVPRWGVRVTATWGLALVGVGLLVMVGGVSRGHTFTIVVGMVVGEAGFMLANVPLTVAGTSAVEARHAGLAAGTLNTSMQLGGAAGLAAVAGVAASLSGPASRLSPGAVETGLALCLLAFCVPALVVSLGLRDRDYRPVERRRDEVLG